MRHSLVALAVFLLAGPAFADTLTLKNGGTVEGLIETIVFRHLDKKISYERAEVASIALDAGNLPDTIILANELDKSGELVSVTVRTVAGVLSFGRERLAKIEIKDGPLHKRVAEFKRRRAAIQNNDAAGLCKLAVWCKDNALVAEARATATECLELKPDDDTAATAHLILGHELKDGRWREPPRPAAKPAAKDEPKPTVTAKAVDAALVALMEKIIAEYGVWAAQAKQADHEKWKKKYEPVWEKARQMVADAKAALDKSKGDQKRLADEVRVQRARCKTNKCPLIKKRADDLQKQLNGERSNGSRLQKEYSNLKTKRLGLVSRMKAARSRIRWRGEARVRRVALAKSKITRLLRMGRQLTEAEMRQICKELVGR